MLFDPSVVPEERRDQLRRVATDLCYCAERLERQREREGKLPTRSRSEIHTTERDALEPLLKTGFTIIGTGAGRCVLRFPESSNHSGYVAKLARFGDRPSSIGIIQNQCEVQFWFQHGSNTRWPLLPIVDYHRDRFRWIMTPYGESLTELPEDEQQPILRRIQNRLVMLTELDVREVRAENVVLVDEDPYLADYGRPPGY